MVKSDLQTLDTFLRSDSYNYNVRVSIKNTVFKSTCLDLP